MASNKIKEFPPAAKATDITTTGFQPNTVAVAEEVNASFKNVSVVTTALANTLAKESNVNLDSTTTSSALTKITDKLVFDNGSGTSQPSGTQNGQAACVVTNPSGAKEIGWAGFCWGEAAQGEYYLNSKNKYSLVLNSNSGLGFYDVLTTAFTTNNYNFPIFKVDRTVTSDGKAVHYGTLVEATSNTKSNPAPNNIVVKVSRKTPGSSQGDDPTQTYVFSDVVKSVYTTTPPVVWNDSIMNNVLRVSDLIDKNQAGQPEAVNFRGSGFGLTKLKAHTLILQKNIDYSGTAAEHNMLVTLAKNTGEFVISVSVEVSAGGVYSGGFLTYGYNSSYPENVLISYVVPTSSSVENLGGMTTRSLFSNNHPRVIIEYIEIL